MAETTKISWSDATWNPWQGCIKVSQGCKHCYMYRDMERYGRDARDVRRSATPTFRLPLQHDKTGAFKILSGSRVFTCSWSDWFIEEADPWRDDAWAIIAQRPDVDFLVLTKRPERIADHLPRGGCPPNVWLGTSIESQDHVGRLVDLLRVPGAPVYWVSCEPLIAPLLLRVPKGTELAGRLGWIVIGGESGPSARPFNLGWARRLMYEAVCRGVAVHVKQLGRAPYYDGPEGEVVELDLRDPKGGDMAEWPPDLRVREWPAVQTAP